MVATVVRQSIYEGDITVPSAAQKYVLGETFTNASGQTFKYVKSHAALTAFQPYCEAFSAVAGAQVKTAAPATLAAPGELLIVPQVAVTSGYYFWGLIAGPGKVLMTSETYAVGDHLQVLNAGTALVVDGSTGSTAKLVNSTAICTEAGTTAVARGVYLFGEKAVTAAT